MGAAKNGKTIKIFNLIKHSDPTGETLRKMQSLLHSVGEYLTPTLKNSNFLETGRLTPEEVNPSSISKGSEWLF